MLEEIRAQTLKSMKQMGRKYSDGMQQSISEIDRDLLKLANVEVRN